MSVVGKQVAWKNQDDIIDFLIKLEKENVFAHLFILGSGEMMEAWKHKAARLQESKIYFMGFVSPEELLSDQVVITSSNEYEGLFIIRHKLFFPYDLKFHAIRLFHFLMRWQVKKS